MTAHTPSPRRGRRKLAVIALLFGACVALGVHAYAVHRRLVHANTIAQAGLSSDRMICWGVAYALDDKVPSVALWTLTRACIGITNHPGTIVAVARATVEGNLPALAAIIRRRIARIRLPIPPGARLEDEGEARAPGIPR